jgi:hypothetical protein
VAAAMNDVAAVTRRLIMVLLDPEGGDFRTIVQKSPLSPQFRIAAPASRCGGH